MRKALPLVAVFVTLSSIAYAEDPVYYVTQADGYSWFELSYEEKAILISGFKLGVWAFDQELRVFWDMNTGNLIDRWRDLTVGEHIKLTDEWYQQTQRYGFKLWMVIFAQGDEDYIYEFENRPYRN